MFVYNSNRTMTKLIVPVAVMIATSIGLQERNIMSYLTTHSTHSDVGHSVKNHSDNESKLLVGMDILYALCHREYTTCVPVCACA